MMQEYPSKNECDFSLELFDQCDCCGMAIRYGNAILEVCRLVERRGIDMETGRGIITVIDQAQLAFLCAGCANRLADRRLVMKRLMALLDLPVSDSNPVPAISDQTASQPEICNLCGTKIAGDKERITVARRIAQVDYGGVWENAIITTMDAEDMLYFCIDCGNDMGAPRLSEAVLTVVAEMVPPVISSEESWGLLYTAGIRSSLPFKESAEDDNRPLAAKKLEMVEDAVRTVRNSTK